MTTKKSPLTIIFFTVFIDLIGFGMIIPLSPYLGREYGASALEVGLLLSAYSLMQIVFSPVWGRWSDVVGRRPIILLSLLGTGLAHLSFAYSGALWMLFVSRTMAGIFGANISTAMAYAADVTDEKDRSKGIGLMGAAFALGFVFGPFFGGILGDLGAQIGTQPPFGHSFPALVAAVLCFINVGFGYFYLGESLPPEKRQLLPPRKSKIKTALDYFGKPVTGPLLFVTFLASFSMSQMEASLFLLVSDRFGLGLSAASFAFAYVGIVIAFTQGYLIRKLLPILGERKLMVWGTVLSGVALGFIGVSPSLSILAIVITVMSVGFGIRMPALNGSISLTSSAQEQGAVMGVNQSLQALGRVLGPPLGGWVYGAFGPELNFFVAGFFGIIGIVIIWRVYDVIPDSGHDTKLTSNLSTKSDTNTFQEEKSAPTSTFAAELKTEISQQSEIKKEPIKPTETPKSPFVIPDRPRVARAPEPPRVEHVRKEDRITVISASQFRSLFASNVNFLFFDLRAPEATPQYSRAVRLRESDIEGDLAKRSSDKRAPILILCEDGLSSKEVAKKIADQGYINVVIVDGGAKALNRTGHV